MRHNLPIYGRKTRFPAFAVWGLLLLVTLAVSGAARGGEAGARTQPGAITLGEALVLFASGEAQFIDARSRKDYEQGHIQSALSLPLETQAAGLPGVVEGVGEGLSLVVYCDDADGASSARLAERLQGLGRRIHVFGNGWTQWTRQKLPVEPADLGAAFGHDTGHCPSCER